MLKDWVLNYTAVSCQSRLLAPYVPQNTDITNKYFIYLFRIKKEQDYNATVAVYKTFIQVCFTFTKCAIYTASIFTATLSDPPMNEVSKEKSGN